MHAIMVGAIVWGSLRIPVKAYAAKEEREGFTWLCRECLTPLQQRRWCPACGVERPAEQVVRGVRQGERYVALPDPEEVTGTREDGPPGQQPRERQPAERLITLTSFAVRETVDPVHLDRSYFLEPGAPEAKGFRLLRRALEVTGRVALGRTALRQRESAVLLRPYGRLLMLHTLNRPEEIRRTAGLATGAGRIGAKDLQSLVREVEAATRPFTVGSLKP
jgi:DNA end-binding protein Ku